MYKRAKARLQEGESGYEVCVCVWVLKLATWLPQMWAGTPPAFCVGVYVCVCVDRADSEQTTMSPFFW